MDSMERAALAVLSGLEREFGAVSLANVSFARTSVPIGIEVEVPWSAYHPELWKKYFLGGARSFERLSKEEHDALTEECRREEESLFPKLEIAKRHIKMFEGVRYFEYCFPPTKNLLLVYGIFMALSQSGLCPFSGRHRMQVTLGGIKPSEYVYVCLMYLELKYGTGERMTHGRKGKGGWAIKGRAGVHHKEREDLEFGYRDASELRSLVLPENLRVLQAFLADVGYLSSLLWESQASGAGSELLCLKNKMKGLLISQGLPYARWLNPVDEEKHWLRLVEVFPLLQASLEPLSHNKNF